MSLETSHETLIVVRDGPVLKVTLSRPEARNALSPTMVRELAQVLQDARDDANIRAVVLMGAGGTFCAGGDLKGMEGRAPAAGDAGADSTAASNRRFGALLEMADALPKAVIALVEGAAMGGGVGLIAVADWVIAEKAAQIGTPEVTVGIVPAQIAPFLVQRIGYGEARRLATYGLRLGAEEAQRVGLVHEVADGRDDLAAKAVAAVNQCLRCAPRAVAEAKRLVRASLAERQLGPVLDQAAEMFAAALAGEAREGIRAFVEKRRPAWSSKIERL
jgi:isohexenylglutaconyl-CoA hydratase